MKVAKTVAAAPSSGSPPGTLSGGCASLLGGPWGVPTGGASRSPVLLTGALLTGLHVSQLRPADLQGPGLLNQTKSWRRAARPAPPASAPGTCLDTVYLKHAGIQWVDGHEHVPALRARPGVGSLGWGGAQGVSHRATWGADLSITWVGVGVLLAGRNSDDLQPRPSILCECGCLSGTARGPTSPTGPTGVGRVVRSVLAGLPELVLFFLGINTGEIFQ